MNNVIEADEDAPKSIFEQYSDRAHDKWTALSDAILRDNIENVSFHKIGIDPVGSALNDNFSEISRQALLTES